MSVTFENYRAIFDHACDAIFIYDIDLCQIIDVNHKVSELFGYTSEEARNADFETFSAGRHPYTITSALKRFERAAAGEHQFFEWLAKDRNGRNFWVEVNIKRAVIDSESVLLVFMRDISERKRTEQLLALQYSVTRALSEASSLSEATPSVLRVICEHVGWDHGEVWFIDTEASVLRLGGVWNDFPAQMPEFYVISSRMSFSRGAGLPGQVWAEGRPVWITDVAEASNFLRAAGAFKGGLHAAFGFPIKSAGSILGTMTFFSRVARPPDKEVLSMFDAVGSQIGDFMKRKKIEDDLWIYSTELERSNKELQQFAYIVSHDLQEPLRSVSGFLELLRRKYQGNIDERADKYISFAVQGARRMSSMISDLLAYSRVGSQPSQAEAVDMNAVFDLAMENLKTAIRENNAAVTSDKLPTVTGDQMRLLQVFQNLIGNALKFMKKDVQPQVHISAKHVNDEWVFGVRDNGIGIDARHHDKIFMIFERLHSREEYPGTGVGLAICKKIIERAGGRIWVSSEPGKGSIFYFSVPDREVRIDPAENE